MKKLIVIPVFVIIVLVMLGCGIKQDKSVAESLASDLFEAIKVGDIEKALTFYSPEFLQHIPQEEWESILNSLDSKLGSFQSYELVTWHYKKQLHTSGTGTIIVLQYKVTYSKYPATEVLTLFRPVGGRFQILGHQISSIGLLK